MLIESTNVIMPCKYGRDCNFFTHVRTCRVSVSGLSMFATISNLLGMTSCRRQSSISPCHTD